VQYNQGLVGTPLLVYNFGDGYQTVVEGTYTDSDWGKYFYGVPSGLQLSASVATIQWTGAHSPASIYAEGNFYASNS
jgi:hypothetical protein